VAVVNDAGSPLAEAAQWVLPLHAGAETSARRPRATSRSSSPARASSGTGRTTRRCSRRSRRCRGARARCLCRLAAAVDALVDADKLFVIGRGTSLAIAMEAALKFKEVCGIQAEASRARRSVMARWR